MPPPIHRLDDVTASRIAAGEVVERPSSVVKELVENSLDAGAGDIRVEIQSGGRRLIRVTDDGAGIPADEVELAFERHTTSKLRDAAELEAVATLGFRGEALASIAAVSHLTAVTRVAAAELGTRVRIDNGGPATCAPVGAPVGTTITVENLFNAVPARLKFLSSERTEAGHIKRIVVHYALAYPERRFLLVQDGRTTFQSPGTGELTDTLIAAFGLEVASAMLPVEAEPPPARPELEGADAPARVAVRGYVSPPHVHRATRRDITLFVNGRLVHDRALTYAVVQAYHTLLPKGRNPLAVLMVGVPPSAVDVNVHPAKTEVRFRDGRPVFGAVQKAVRRAVVDAPVAPAGGERGAGDELPDLRPALRVTREGGRSSRVAAEAGATQAALPGTSAEADETVPMLRVVGQVQQAYIVAEGPDGLYLIDQHAAHERVMYERFMARDAPVRTQQLLEAEAVALSDEQLGVLDEHAASFDALGFEIEPFGPDTVLVRALPEVLASSGVAETLRTVLDLTAAGSSPVEDAFEARLVRAVCKQATIKAGQTLSLDEMRALVRDLEAAEAPRTCPHGRPTMITLDAKRLEREFGRV